MVVLGLERIEALRKWRELADAVVSACSKIVEVREAYVFGSVLKGEVSGSSDLDIIVVVPDEVDVAEVRVRIAEILERNLGHLAMLVDPHITNTSNACKPPYSWFIKEGVKIR